jgi:hypothetical protein
MEAILGINNGYPEYLLVLIVYALMFLLIRYPKPVIELNYRGTFKFLAALWIFLMFTGNYLFFRLGLMSFLPWLNNFIHSFLWIGVCLTWLYYCTHERPSWEQFIHFSFTSFIIKMTEHLVLGSWSRDSYAGIDHPLAYLIAMSLVDGFYPLISKFVLAWASKGGKFGVYIH